MLAFFRTVAVDDEEALELAGGGGALGAGVWITMLPVMEERELFV